MLALLFQNRLEIHTVRQLKYRIKQELNYLIGLEFHWRPEARHASTWCKVKDIIIKDNGEILVDTVEIDKNGNELENTRTQNDMALFIESVSFTYSPKKET